MAFSAYWQVTQQFRLSLRIANIKHFTESPNPTSEGTSRVIWFNLS